MNTQPRHIVQRHYQGEIDFLVAARNDEIIELYLAGYSLRNVGTKVGLSHMGVRKVLLKHAITLRSSEAPRVREAGRP